MAKQKDWYNYKRTLTRKELLKLCWTCSIPFVGWMGLGLAMFLKGHKQGGGWK